MVEKKVTSKVNDSTDLWKTFLDYILERAKKRYNTVDEMSEDINKMFKGGMEVIQQNYDRWFEHELKPNMAMYGIELLGGEGDDVVVEDMPDAVDEDPFMTDEDRQSGEGIDEENFFNDEEDNVDENGNPKQPMVGDEDKKPFLDNNNMQ